jgi:hypothetical protein
VACLRVATDFVAIRVEVITATSASATTAGTVVATGISAMRNAAA